MRGSVFRLIIILGTFLISATWFPQSLLPMWTVLLAAHFFSLREGLIILIGYTTLGVAAEYQWQFFLQIWLGISISFILRSLTNNRKVSIPPFFLACLLTSLIIQLVFSHSPITSNVLLTIKHMFFIAITLVPTKVLGEAYQRYFNALGRNYE
ncbi:MAG: hypothetical protein HY817_04655 [Candidatus Abawacabacteria bacterium]|nr:hypothetical protein [Candidatus Abawacabacteria bacterium]